MAGSDPNSDERSHDRDVQGGDTPATDSVLEASGTISDFGGQGVWEVDGVAAGWTADEDHMIVLEAEDYGVCEACGRRFADPDPVEIVCHYWGVPLPKYREILDELESMAGADARRYYELATETPGHLSIFEVFMREQRDHPRRAPSTMVALVAKRHLEKFTSRQDLEIADLAPEAE